MVRLGWTALVLVATLQGTQASLVDDLTPFDVLGSAPVDVMEDSKEALKTYCAKYNKSKKKCNKKSSGKCKYKSRKSKCAPKKAKTTQPPKPTPSPTPKPSAMPTASPSASPTAAPVPAVIQSSLLPNAGESIDVELLPEALLAVPRSQSGLVSVIVDADGVPQARSYDGFDWEALHGDVVECDGSECVVDFTEEARALNDVTIRTYSSMSLSTDQEDARFLLQSTFGPSRDAMDDITTGESRFKEWIEAQAELPATSLREYYRKRVNPPIQVTAPPGRARTPCEANSRWHRHAFSVEDVGKTIVVSDEGSYLDLIVDGVSRHHWTNTGSWPVSSSLKPLVICEVDPREDGLIKVGNGCKGSFSNPALEFTSTDSARTIALSGSDLQDLTPAVNGVKLLVSDRGGCDLPGFGPVYATAGGLVYMHERRLVLVDNSLESMAAGAQSYDMCPQVTHSFVNSKTCTVSSASCAPARYTDAMFDLDETNIRKFFTVGGKYVYVIKDLDNDDVESPCSKPSRWRMTAGSCSSPTSIDSGTRNTLTSLLRATFESDGNPIVRDIDAVPDDMSCNDNKAKKAVFDFSHDGTRYCFEHVHNDLYSVLDLSFWTMLYSHPGNIEAFDDGRHNPIRKIAEVDGEVELQFPSWHTTSRWDTNRESFHYLGKLYDRVNFADLPPQVRTPEMAAFFGASETVSSDPTENIIMHCGSPGEVASEPLLGSRYGMGLADAKDADPFRGRLDETNFKYLIQSTVWTMVTLTAEDQLRQRVAWALSQILVVSARDTGGTAENEIYLAYYDILVRNALGKYRDVLREVSYSPLMGRMLSFVGSRSKASSGSFPDENFAREIMQLFTIGLVELNLDGTEVLDETGEPKPTYSNEDILEFARAWTGFVRRDQRGNYERNHVNEIDPMGIKGEFRDPFPKLGLHGNYIGDGFAVCEEMHPRAFLRKGAKYRFLGSRPTPEFQDDPTADLVGEAALRVELDPSSSALAAALCGASDASDLSQCSFQPELELDANLACDGLECEIDTVRIVMVPSTERRCPQGTILNQHDDDSNHGDTCDQTYEKAFVCPTGCSAINGAPHCIETGSNDVPCSVDASEHRGLFFEYVQPACVHLTFFNDGRRVVNRGQRHATCNDPRTIVAAEACCDATDSRASVRTRGANGCLYGGERMTYASAQQRCESKFGQSECDFEFVREECPITPYRLWTSGSCSVQVKIDDDGKIAIVHDVGQSPKSESTKDNMRDVVDRKTENWFRALWNDGEVPNAEENNCGPCIKVAAVLGGKPTCLCDTETVETAVFSSLPTVEEALEKLHIGSSPVDSFDASEFVLAATEGGVKVWRRQSGTLYDAQTVFEVTSLSRTLWLRNARSDVRVTGTDATFRNPPTFHNLDVTETGDALHETEAVLDHYMYHPNTAPFVAKLLIQHLVTSNPSGRYVETVATAFIEGVYDGVGSGEYGDLLATTAAILLDREARNAVLDADPAHGQHRQSMMKMIHVMRAMEMQSDETQATEVVMRYIEERMGMEPLNAPSVFSFYLPSYAPPGPIKDAGLVAPETQLLTSPVVVSSINAMFSLAKYGLTNCEGGLGLQRDFDQNCKAIRQDRTQSLSRGKLTFEPSSTTTSQVIDELDLLLTGGRLDDATRSLIINEYDQERFSSDRTEAMRLALQLFFTSPHFHSTNQCEPRSEPRPEPAEEESPARASEPHKAVVYVNFHGGMDSFSALVPHSDCDGKDLYAEYASVRSNVAIDKSDLLTIDATGDGQPCNRFGIHPALKKLQKVYEDGDAVFMANTGALVEPIAEKGGDEAVPRGLFAHNIQQRALQTNVPQSNKPSGVLGRLQDELAKEGFVVGSFSIAGNNDMLSSGKSTSKQPDILDASGLALLDERAQSSRVRPAIESMNEPASSSVFGEMWSSTLERTLARNDELISVLDGVDLEQYFKADGPLGSQLMQVARLINTRQGLGTNRNVFYTSLGGFDSHADHFDQLNGNLKEADAALDSFVQELKLQGVWDDVVVVIGSEFGRTLTSNGVGTDHGWGGNYFMLGGGLKGGRIVGKYPDDLTDGGPLNLGRGRLIPTTSWDAIWNAISDWLGLPSSSIDAVLPNRNNFGADLFTKTDLFNN